MFTSAADTEFGALCVTWCFATTYARRAFQTNLIRETHTHNIIYLYTAETTTQEFLVIDLIKILS